MELKDWLIVGAVGLAWLNRDKLAQALNPLNNNNAVNTAANKALGYDNKTNSIGSDMYDKVQQARKKLGLSYDKTTDAGYGRQSPLKGKSKYQPSSAARKAQAKKAAPKINASLFPAIATDQRLPTTIGPIIHG